MPPIAVHVDPSEFPTAAREALWAELARGRLPGKLLYQSPAQAARWLAYHDAWSPSRAAAAVRRMYGEALATAARDAAAEGRGALCVGLGCGGGHKDRILLDAAAAQGAAPLAYVPLDASAPLVLEAALHAREGHPDLPVHPLVADLSAEPPLGGWLDGLPEAAAPRAFTCFGMLPNLEPGTFPGYLAGLLRPEDRLLLSANLSPHGHAADRAAILAQYDNPPARAWYAGALRELGLDADTAPLEIETGPIPGMADGEAAWRVVVTARLQRDAVLALYDREVPLGAGSTLTVFRSHRFTDAAARDLLEAAGLALAETWVDPSGEEGIYLCTKD